MTGLIDRQAAIDAVHYEWDACLNFDGSGTEIANDTEKALCDVPSVDAVEVVRCKDCKWYKTNYSWNGKEFKICVREATEPARRPDDFCNYGERKDD